MYSLQKHQQPAAPGQQAVVSFVFPFRRQPGELFADCLSDPGKLLDHVLASRQRQTLRALFQQTNIEKK